MAISPEDSKELLELSRSSLFREDAQRVAASRHNPFMTGDEINVDQITEFLNQYNELLNHPVKPPRPFIETNMKL